MLTLSLPVAPTANNAFVNRKGGRGYGRIKSKAYRSWLKQADAHYALQKLGRVKPILGAYRCEMTFCRIVRGDLDGRIKILLDWLVARNLVQGDDPKFLRELNAKFSGEPGNLVQIIVREVQE